MTDASFLADQRSVTPGKVRLAAVWRRTLQIFAKAPLTFLALVLLPLLVSVAQIGIQLPMIIAGPRPVKTTPHEAAVIATLVLTVLQYVLQIVSQVASIHIASRLLVGDRFTWGDALGVGMRRFFPFVGVAILVGISIVLGLFLLVVPGLIVAIVLALAVPACVVERLGPIDAMKRSVILTRSNRWRILAAFLVGILLPLFAAGAVSLVGASLLGKVPAAILVGILFIVLLPCLGAMSIIMLTVLFVELRALKEGGIAPRSVSQVLE